MQTYPKGDANKPKDEAKKTFDEILSDVRGLKDIAGIAEKTQRQLTTGMLDNPAEKCTD